MLKQMLGLKFHSQSIYSSNSSGGNMIITITFIIDSSRKHSIQLLHLAVEQKDTLMPMETGKASFHVDGSTRDKLKIYLLTFS